MTEDKSLSWIRSAVEAQRSLDPPSVDRVQPQVRSGANVPALSGQRSKVTDDQRLVGNVVIEWGYDIPRSRLDEFQNLLATLEPRIADNLPAGLAYSGSFAVFSSSEKGSGRYRTIWTISQVERLGALGEAEQEASWPDSAQFIRELRDLWDPQGGWSESMYQIIDPT